MVETPRQDVRARSVRREPAGKRPCDATSMSRVIAGLCVCMSACSGAVDESDAVADGDGPHEIRGGAVDAELTAVFALAVRRGSESLGLCTATLIERNLFITARHCLVETSRVVRCETSEFEEPLVPLEVALVNATELDEDSLERAPVFRGVSVFLPDTDRVCGADIALVEISEQVPRSIAVPITPRLDDMPRPGERYTAVGYGGTRDDGRGGGIRRSRRELRVLCNSEGCGGPVAREEFLGEVGTCEGDSGGPALDENGNLIGVLSRGGEDCTLPIYGAATAWARLLVLAARTAADSGGYAPPAWAGELPPDGEVGGEPGTPPFVEPSRTSTDDGCAFRAPSGGSWSGFEIGWISLGLLGAVRRVRGAPRTG